MRNAILLQAAPRPGPLPTRRWPPLRRPHLTLHAILPATLHYINSAGSSAKIGSAAPGCCGF